MNEKRKTINGIIMIELALAKVQIIISMIAA